MPDSSGLLAYTIDPNTGALSAISSLPYDTGNSPEDIQIDSSGKFVYVDSISPPEITGFQIDQSTGALQSIPASPFAASETPFLMAASSNFLYASSTDVPGGVLGFRINVSGVLSALPASPFGAGQSTVSVALQSSGAYAAVLSDATQAVASWKIDQSSGALSPTGTPLAIGSTPQLAIVSPQGFVYVSAADGIHGYAIDQATGALTAISSAPFGPTSGPILLDPSSKFLFTVSADDTGIVTYSVGSTGMLTQVSKTPSGTVLFTNLAAAKVTH